MALPQENLKAVTFQSVTPTQNTEYLISAFDLNGNVIQEQIIEVDATNFEATITLPLISELGTNNNAVFTVVCKSNNAKKVFVQTSGSDAIGAYALPLAFTALNSTLGLKVASEGNWTITYLGAKLG